MTPLTARSGDERAVRGITHTCLMSQLRLKDPVTLVKRMTGPASHNESVTITRISDLHFICDRIRGNVAEHWKCVLSVVTYPAPVLGRPPPFVDVSS